MLGIAHVVPIALTRSRSTWLRFPAQSACTVLKDDSTRPQRRETALLGITAQPQESARHLHARAVPIAPLAYRHP